MVTRCRLIETGIESCVNELVDYLATDHHCSWYVLTLGLSLDSIVRGDDVQNIQQLPFVLVYTFDLHVVQRHGIDLLVLSFQEPFCQSNFILLLHALYITHEWFVVNEVLQILKFVEFRDPALADFLYVENELRATAYRETRAALPRQWHRSDSDCSTPANGAA